MNSCLASNLEYTKSMRNTNPLVIRNTSEIIYFSVLKNITYFQTAGTLNMLNAKYYDSGPAAYQSENTARDT